MSGNLVSITLHREPLDCPQCGRAWHLKRGLCVACLLACGLDGEMHDGQTLDDELDQISGKRDELIGRLQKKYGYAREDAEREVEAWSRDVGI